MISGYNCTRVNDPAWPISFEEIVRIPFMYKIMEPCLFNKAKCNKHGMITKGMLFAVLNNPPDNFTRKERLTVLYGLKILKLRSREEFDTLINMYNLSNYYADFRD